jgi:hypothetical protein
MFRSFDINEKESLIVETETGVVFRLNIETGDYRIEEDAEICEEDGNLIILYK